MLLASPGECCRHVQDMYSFLIDSRTRQSLTQRNTHGLSRFLQWCVLYTAVKHRGRGFVHCCRAPRTRPGRDRDRGEGEAP